MSKPMKLSLTAIGTIVAIVLAVGGVVYSGGYQARRIDDAIERTTALENRQTDNGTKFEEINRSLGHIEGVLNAAFPEISAKVKKQENKP